MTRLIYIRKRKRKSKRKHKRKRKGVPKQGPQGQTIRRSDDHTSVQWVSILS